MQTAAFAVILLFAVWVGLAGLAAILDPRRARGWIARFATSHRVNLAEQAWRGLAGAALIVRASQSLAPKVFTVAGWILVVSALALLVIPLRWHAGYARYWAEYLPLPLVRLAGLVGVALAAALAVAAIG